VIRVIQTEKAVTSFPKGNGATDCTPKVSMM